MAETTQQGRNSDLRDWLAVEGDLDDFIFYGDTAQQSEK
jgi:hypothetical protein